MYETVLQGHTATIEECYAQLRAFAKQEAVDKADIDRLYDTILRPDTGVLKAMNVIHAFVKGNEFPLLESGILEVLTESLLFEISSSGEQGRAYEEGLSMDIFGQYMANGQRTPFDGYLQTLYSNFEKCYSILEDYFSKYLLIQLRGVNLIVEAYLYKNQTGLARDYLETTYPPRMQAQADTFMACVDTLVFNAHPTPLAEFPNMGPLPADPALYAGVPGILDAVQASMPYLAQIYPRADYLVDKCVKSPSEPESDVFGVFKARAQNVTALSEKNVVSPRSTDQFGVD